RGDSTLVMTFRDQNGTYRRLASVSKDRGENWSIPVLTNMPDSRSKQSAGNLPDGTAYLVGNPVTDKPRIPLAVTLSEDAYWFNTAYALRKGGNDLQPLRYEGLFKREGYHYPKSMVWGDHLYVSYATNKEDVEYTRVPLSSLKIDTSVVNSISPELGKGINIRFDVNGVVSISLEDFHRGGVVHIFGMNGQLLSTRKINHEELEIDMKDFSSGTYLIDVQTEKGRKVKMVKSW
ncbi:MAG: exo-alpha-sialidase, partial [Bacteroidetes bacterium]|nr:exo-alpha-sialidase [Bacteroidota bacterium]